jgi:hypothetical protein
MIPDYLFSVFGMTMRSGRSQVSRLKSGSLRQPEMPKVMAHATTYDQSGIQIILLVALVLRREMIPDYQFQDYSKETVDYSKMKQYLNCVFDLLYIELII